MSEAPEKMYLFGKLRLAATSNSFGTPADAEYIRADKVEEMCGWNPVSMPPTEDKRILAFTPNPDPVMRYRTVSLYIFKTMSEATHWKYLDDPQIGDSEKERHLELYPERERE